MKNYSIKKFIAAGLLSTALISTGIIPLSADNHVYAETSSVEKVISVGSKYLGTPYEFGSDRSTTKTFDCSDFTKHIFKVAADVSLPSTSATQAAYLKNKSVIQTNWKNLKRGDLMFFMSYHGSSATSYSGMTKSKQPVTHVGVYLGNGKMLDTYSNESGGVRVDNIANTQWEYRFIFGASVL